MSRRALASALAAAACLTVGACTEKPQTNAQGVKFDAQPWTGTGAQPAAGTAFTAPGWKPGESKSWQEQLKTRAMYGQNDYSREN